MSKKHAILTVIDTFGSLNFADLHRNLTTGQSKSALSVYLTNLKNEGLIEQDYRTKRYSLTKSGTAHVDGRSKPKKPLRDLPNDPDEQPAAPAANITPELIAEFQKLHGQLGRVIKCMREAT